MLRVKVRLDFKGVAKASYFFFGGRNPDKMAEEIREQQIALLKNIPVQGIEVEEIIATAETYTITDSIHNDESAYAPLEVTLRADTLEDLVRFVMRDEFRKIEILEPQEIVLSKQELERLLAKINEEMKCMIPILLRKIER